MEGEIGSLLPTIVAIGFSIMTVLMFPILKRGSNRTGVSVLRYFSGLIGKDDLTSSSEREKLFLVFF